MVLRIRWKKNISRHKFFLKPHYYFFSNEEISSRFIKFLQLAQTESRKLFMECEVQYIFIERASEWIGEWEKTDWIIFGMTSGIKHTENNGNNEKNIYLVDISSRYCVFNIVIILINKCVES